MIVESATSPRQWADLINERFVPLQIRPTASADLVGSVRTRTLAHLQVSSVSSAPQTFTRSRAMLRSGRDLLAVGRVEGGRGFLEQDGRQCEVPAGAFAFYDTTRPFTWALEGAWRLQVFTWPREGLGIAEAELARVTAIQVPNRSGVGSFVAPMLSHAASATSFSLQGVLAGRLADQLAEMAITAALAQVVDPIPAALSDSVLKEIQAYIEDNLPDPYLTPEKIAEAFFMSTRTLHRIFGRQGVTVAAWIKTRRLDLARRLLASDRSGLPITQIASRVGFSNPSFFSREFSSRFHTSPRQYRARRG